MESDKAAIQDALKQQAAARAASYVQTGMVVGLGTGSTAAFVIAALIGRARAEGLRFIGVPTSERSAQQARDGGLELSDLAAHPSLDLTIDGADQVELGSLNLIKGMGGALLREKIVAAASQRLVIVVDGSKLADVLALPVPVEVARFGWQATQRQVQKLGAMAAPRQAADGSLFITDGGDVILDCDFGPLHDPAMTNHALRDIVGVIETGLFIGRASEVLVAEAAGVRRLLPA
jgi:ribose 5-phosphate isomerase A